MIWTRPTRKQVVIRRVMVIDVVYVPTMVRKRYAMESKQRWFYIASHVAMEVGFYLLFMLGCISVVGLLMVACGWSEIALWTAIGAGAVTAVETVKRSISEWKHWSRRADGLVGRKA